MRCNREEIMKGYQYVLFDLDGTLTESGPGIMRCVQYALDRFGIHENDPAKLQRFIGPPLDDSFRTFYGFSEEDARRAREFYRERYWKKGIYENAPYPGIPAMLETLQEEGRSLALATSKPQAMAEEVLRHFDLMKYLDVLVGAGMNGEHQTKPEVVALALAGLGVNEENHNEAAMVGDRSFDIEGAKARKIDSVGVLYGYSEGDELAQAGASYLAETVADLGKILRSSCDDRLPYRNARA